MNGVVVLSGAPGVGKSTVARLLTDQWPDSVHLHSDDFWGFIRRGAIAPFLPEAHQQNEVVVGVLAQAACGYAAGGYRVVCDGVVGPWFVGAFRAAARERGVGLDYVVLVAEEETALARATGRGEGALRDPGPVRALHRQFRDLGEYAGHALDSTALTAQETAAAVKRGLTAGAYQC